ncbi:MAG: TlpA family protein disulfide reductase [Bacteroidetes bacterium]|nr:MAG: TlpA family protein disulfide reductase [Bacteroidota bacterium]
MYKSLLFLSFSVFSQAIECTISGTSTLKSQTKKIVFTQINLETRVDNVIDSILINEDGSFKKIVKLKEQGMYGLVLPDKNSIPLAIDKSENIFISFLTNPTSISGSSGSQLLIDYEQFRKKSFEKWMKPIYDSVTKYEDLQNQSKKIFWAKKQASSYNLHRTELTDFVRKNMMNSTAAYNSALRWNPNTDINFIDSLVQNIEKKYSNTLVANHLKDRFERIKSTAIGSIAPEIMLSDSAGKTIKLSEKRGKYILLDFWASWCRPCRQMSDQLVDFNQKFKDKNVEIFSVSIDDKAENWKKAILKDKYTWTNVSDLLGWKSKAAFQYNVNAIPSNLLIDKNGKIIAKNFNMDEATELIIKELSK